MTQLGSSPAQLGINPAQPLVMHIDLNSCFATVEQQAHPHLRGKPIGVAAYDTPNGCILAPSIEAKTFGIKTGMRVKEARMLCPHLIVRTTDPPMIRDVHLKFRKLLSQYTPDYSPKSIDEIVMNFETAEASMRKNLLGVGREIKQRIRNEIGEWMVCSVGIGTNRFLAKTAASLKKPDGLVEITDQNLLDVYRQMELMDLYGISFGYQARLNRKGIYTPLEFFEASSQVLERQVFKSICGNHWYRRLRGWEADGVDFDRKSFGQQYALQKRTDDPKELARLLMKLCEKMGRRLRRHGAAAHALHLGFRYSDHTYWHHSQTFNQRLSATTDLFHHAMTIFNQQPEQKIVSLLSVTCMHLSPDQLTQPSLFDLGTPKSLLVSKALDAINDRFGEFTIAPALMLDMNNTIRDSVAFGGGVREMTM